MFDLSFIHTSPFYEITALLVLAAALGFVSLLLRQPMIVSFIAAGILAGPSVLDIVQTHEYIELLAELGIALLLFLVGLKLDVSLVRSLGMVSLATGLGQVLFTSVIGFFIGILLGIDALTSLYIAVALTFSSTIIIVKLLSDKKEVDSLHGRIALGFLIVQDIVVVLAMMILSASGIGSGEGAQQGSVTQVLSILSYGALLILLLILFVKYLATPLVNKFAFSPELLVTFALGWAAFLATLGDVLGFSMELGGLLAGISLASTPVRESLVARMASLRDFLLLFFFISLGMNLDLQMLGSQIDAALIFSLFILIGNPLIVMIIMGALGYRKRTGFLAGLTVAQISEFSLIFIAMGVSLGHLSPETMGLVTLVGLITIALSVYMITYSHALYRFLEPYLGLFERSVPVRESGRQSGEIAKKHYDIILFGLGRFGSVIARELEKNGYHLLTVDFNPDEVRKWKKKGCDAVYGDASDQEFLSGLPLSGVRWVISAVSMYEPGVMLEDPRMVLIDTLKKIGFQGKIAVTTQRISEKEPFLQRGADRVFLPFYDAAEQAARRINEDIG
ncbi:cation:proton antiporter [Prosthecochloris sp. HL-130-GSB]|uniref:cation:proton antiporter n=1 Tax=Prosthecochloris sp. HL-130-GSB TaxID=1974213 RepID=UPI000A1C0E5E|nr:cation:proton antiporter family protein [Prosthecochloris sp. HL-130-GSB]ARM30920.1 sodium:proton exchanger [Prosthecochloris sp. HL-130-GSB]